MAFEKICIIGCGNMGGACLSGWLFSDEGISADLSRDDFVCVVPSEDDRRRIEADYSVKCVSSVRDIGPSDEMDLLLLAVKPQVLPEVLSELSSSDLFTYGKQPLVLSIAAGIPTEDIEKALPDGVHVVRAMPNMPLQVSHGATAVCGGRSATASEVESVNQMFRALGTSNVVDEGQIDAVCAISGGGPAYVAYMIEALRDAGVALGLDSDLAENLALETVGGSYDSMVEKGLSPEQMRKSVCSPGGTTLAALSEMDSAGFKPMFEDAMKAAVDRAEELRKGA